MAREQIITPILLKLEYLLESSVKNHGICQMHITPTDIRVWFTV